MYSFVKIGVQLTFTINRWDVAETVMQVFSLIVIAKFCEGQSSITESNVVNNSSTICKNLKWYFNHSLHMH